MQIWKLKMNTRNALEITEWVIETKERWTVLMMSNNCRKLLLKKAEKTVVLLEKCY